MLFDNFDWINFQFGVLANTRGFNLLVQQAAEMELLWGIAAGFIVGTIGFAAMTTDRPKDALIMVWYDKTTSFSKIHNPSSKSGYAVSFSAFSKHVHAMQLAINAGIVLLVATLFIGFFKF